ncbi:Dos2-interacting transcription regulator of RNA-Pol-II-domain-containing protein [Catenaria anguillulae PL171]|uniref:MMS19 nucleotide excision repair protein n=1 Tax=Catenaria anguillulae PL171 TaxID=765915 RepID=A0A1Y2HGV3_9FUNG|nr:Dos2-interacting transcription regulator of RNA-Pol-II-domain-containing protein [Catenaria anguillulae PL171]
MNSNPNGSSVADIADAVLQAPNHGAVHQLAESATAIILAKTDSLVACVQVLNPVLTHPDAFAREKGVLFLSKVIEAVCASPQGGATLLSLNEGSLLANFLAAHLTDQLCVPHVALSLAALVDAGLVNPDDLHPVFPQTTRYRFFQLFDLLTTRHLDAIRRSMEQDFIAGYLAAMDGEKDPRNLMLAFRSLRTLSLHCDLTPCAQDVFEASFCYFPITFKPPPNDPSGISAQDLKSALAACLSASPLFAPWAIPAILEKLESANTNAKRDSLSVLHLALPIYGASSHLLTHVPRLWQALKADAFHSADAHHEHLALETLSTLVRVLCVTGESRTNPVDLVLTPALRECLHMLTQPETKLAKVSALVLGAFVRADPDVANSVLATAVPFLVQRLRTEELPAQQKTLVAALVHMVEALAAHPAPPPRALVSLVNDVHAALQMLGLQGVFHLMAVPGLLSADEAATYVQHFASAIEAADRVEGGRELRPRPSSLVVLADGTDLFAEILMALVAKVPQVGGEALGQVLTAMDRVVHAAQAVNAEHLVRLLDAGTLQRDEMSDQVAPEAQSPILAHILSPTSPLSSSSLTFPIFVGILGNLRPTTPLPLSPTDLLSSILSNPSLPDDSVAMLVGSLVNKQRDPLPLLNHEPLAALLNAPGASPRALAVTAWVAKALVMQGNKIGGELTGRILGMVGGVGEARVEARAAAARVVGVIVGESNVVLCKESFAVVKLLYKQRIFNQCLPSLTSQFHTAPDSTAKDLALLALAHLVQNIPQPVLLGAVNDLLPLLLTSLAQPRLALDDPALMVSILDTFQGMLRDAPQAVGDHVSSLVPLVLGLATGADQGVPMRVRIAAVKCLQVMASALPFHVVFPVRHKVIAGLGKVVGDPKRLVRREAVNCRSLWFTVSGEGNGQ